MKNNNNKKQSKQRVSCVTLFGSEKENGQFKRFRIKNEFRRFGDATKMQGRKEWEKEWAHEIHLKTKFWFNPLGVKVLNCVSSASPRNVFSSAH